MASHDVLLALDLVSANGYASAVEKVTLDLERARMEREDFRHGNGPFNQLTYDNEPDWCSTRDMVTFAKDDGLRLRHALKRIRDWYQAEPRAPKYRKYFVQRVVAAALE